MLDGYKYFERKWNKKRNRSADTSAERFYNMK